MRPSDERLTQALRDDLAALAQSLRKGKISAELIARLVPEIAALPPAAVASLDRSIAYAAQLWRYTEGAQFWPRSMFATTHSAQLLRVPGLEMLFVFHCDGFLREAALKRIVGPLSGPFQVAAIVWRLNDWAFEVRKAAADCARRCFPVTCPGVLAQAYLALLTRTSSWRRWQEERAAFDEISQLPGVVTAAAELLRTGQGALSAPFRQLLRSEQIDPHLRDLAIGALQPAIRAIAMQSLIDQTARWPSGYRWQWIEKAYGRRKRVQTFSARPLNCIEDRESLIALAAADRGAALRGIALSAAITYFSGTPLAMQLANRLRGDRSKSVRSRAKFILGA